MTRSIGTEYATVYRRFLRCTVFCFGVVRAVRPNGGKFIVTQRFGIDRRA